MLVLYLGLPCFFDNTTAYSSLQDAIKSKNAVNFDMTGSAFVQECFHYLALYEGVKAYVLERLGFLDVSCQMIVLGFSKFIIFYNACAILSCFLIPKVEYRRIFGSLSDADRPQPVPVFRVTAISAIISFLTLFIYLPSFSYVELYFQQTPELSENRQNIESYAVQYLEKIEDIFFKEGTLAQLQNAKIEALHHTDIALVHLEAQTDRAFDRMEGNVDDYLDWYYSLVGEYTRIGSLLVGELENDMGKKLGTSLQQGDAFKEVQVALGRVYSEYEKAPEAYKKAAEEIMKKNRVINIEPSFQVIKRMSMEDVLKPLKHQDVVNIQQRLSIVGGGGAVAGVITAGVVKNIIGKVMGKSLLKFAAKALSKIVITKTAGFAAGASAGAMAGGTVGSVVPVVGTGVGLFVGAVAGVAISLTVGVSVEKLLMVLEEKISREDFKREILSEIQDARIEFKTKLRFQNGL